MWLRVALVLLAAWVLLAAGDGFTPTIPPNILKNFTAAAIPDFQQCLSFTYGRAGPNVSTLNLMCGGGHMLLACGDTNSSYYRIGAAGNKSEIYSNTVVNSTRFFYNSTYQFGFVNASAAAPTSCMSFAGDTLLCWRISPTQNFILAVGSCQGVTALSDPVSRYVFSTPCEGLSPGDSCVLPGDPCGTGTCSANGTCTGTPSPPCPPPNQCESFLGRDPVTCQCIYNTTAFD